MIFFKKAKATGATFMTSSKPVLLPVLQYIQFVKYLVPYSVPVIFWVTIPFYYIPKLRPK